MKKIFSLLLLLSIALSLISCGKNDDGTPEGMQLVRGGEEYGYYFYAPEEWTISNLGQISAAYASGVDTSSVTYTEVQMPDSVDEYFKESLQEFSTPPIFRDENGEAIASESATGTRITFGNADDAVEYVYEYEYSSHIFRTRQIFVSYGERFGIFTFTAVLENISDKNQTQYDFYKDKLNSMITSFKFVAKSGEVEQPVYESKDGFKLISDPKVARFSLYVPEELEVEYSSGIVGARYSDGANITMTRAMSTGLTISDYWKLREEELSAVATEISVVSPLAETRFGNANSAAACEYTYKYNGIVYHVYQVFSVTTFNGFAFTYTAVEDRYASHIDEVKKIIEKVEF